MIERETENIDGGFAGEEYYQFARCRYWTILEFFRLVFNKKSIKYDKEINPNRGFMSLFFDTVDNNGIESYPFGFEDPLPKTLRTFESTFKPETSLEDKFFNTQVSAKQAYSFAHELHLALDIPKNDPWYLLLEGDKAVKLSEDFLKMGREINPSSYLDLLKICPAWTLKDLIRIIFGERYEENEKVDNQIIGNFIKLVKSHIQANKLISITPIQEKKDLETPLKPINVVNFIWSEPVFGWLMKNGIDILEWVEELFDHVKLEEKIRAKEENAEILSAEEKQYKEKISFFPAPDGTSWDKVKFSITDAGQIRVKINNKQELFSLEKWKSKLPRGKSFNLLISIFAIGTSFSKEDFDEPGQKNNLKQYVSALRKDLKELFDIDSDPFKSIGIGEYQTNFGIQVDYITSPEEEQVTPEDNIAYGRPGGDDTSPEEGQLD